MLAVHPQLAYVRHYRRSKKRRLGPLRHPLFPGVLIVSNITLERSVAVMACLLFQMIRTSKEMIRVLALTTVLASTSQIIVQDRRWMRTLFLSFRQFRHALFAR